MRALVSFPALDTLIISQAADDDFIGHTLRAMLRSRIAHAN
jgi:hypothetical protein